MAPHSSTLAWKIPIPKPFWKCLSTISKTLTEAHFVTYWLHWIVNGPLMEKVDFSYSV